MSDIKSISILLMEHFYFFLFLFSLQFVKRMSDCFRSHWIVQKWQSTLRNHHYLQQQQFPHNTIFHSRFIFISYEHIRFNQIAQFSRWWEEGDERKKTIFLLWKCFCMFEIYLILIAVIIMIELSRASERENEGGVKYVAAGRKIFCCNLKIHAHMMMKVIRWHFYSSLANAKCQQMSNELFIFVVV